MLMKQENEQIQFVSYTSSKAAIPNLKSRNSRARIVKTEEEFLETESSLRSSKDHSSDFHTEASYASSDEDGDNIMQRVKENLMDFSEFPDGPPIEFSKQFMEAALKDEPDSLFNIPEAVAKKVRKEYKRQKRLERQ